MYLQNNFLLSSSMDKTVRLWHASRPECLCCFKHSDFVTSIQFHPRDDRFFLAGSLDSKLRLWSIPDKSVAFSANATCMITAVAFTPDGKYSIAGCLNGLCTIYDTDGLKATSQIHVRSARGRNAKGSKITGIDTIVQHPNDPSGEIKLLITSNDSRVRLYNIRDRSVEVKFRGNENSTSQIRASFSDDGKYIICGSEDRRAYIWSARSDDKETDKRAVEVLEIRTAIVTSAIMAPTATRQLLGLSGDPIYDMCNPPPITLVSQMGSPRSSSRLEVKESAELAKNHHAHENPAYLSRTSHPGGHIIIAADYVGRIKVFRQDCAYNKRPADFLDMSSIFSKKRLGRSNSARQSIASSIGKESKSPSERILAWRSSVVGTEIARIDSRTLGTRSATPPPPNSRKSTSRPSHPSSSIRGRIATADSKPESGYETPPSAARASIDRKAALIAGPASEGELTMPRADFGSFTEAPSVPGVRADSSCSSRSHDDVQPGWLGGQSYAFWSKAKNTLDAMKTQNFLDPQGVDDGRRRSSVPSALSSDIGSAHSGDADEGEVLRCRRCRATDFRATKTKSGKQKLLCIHCNAAHS
jgi:WD repeat-containing protein 44